MTGLRAPSQKPGGGTSGDQLSGGNVGEMWGKDFGLVLVLSQVHNDVLALDFTLTSQLMVNNNIN
ncbi:Uncharacterised protein [Yersinia enterocolitica]|nr:Uncharacterised protein [Yersinia enterocolitica]